ncbi:hypothetical protein CYMTET_27297 [Cymbomonas tetramitiformis]|uniref:Uncharacterized protein n=1 Tax=Cymbomonas tetramitiformis TaxID=36881 RepID=A0AAE0FQM9_9CHLO|nr:hypothetical protein CYMTET_51763 [Cymbomonas tetramitiformis]KAK3263933.1 hypothetical protein CYMTET_27297 [Cymbomonas tetramitiformis]
MKIEPGAINRQKEARDISAIVRGPRQHDGEVIPDLSFVREAFRLVVTSALSLLCGAHTRKVVARVNHAPF